jgi:uncharacterized glyoxalase superfamily protein PhnB
MARMSEGRQARWSIAPYFLVNDVVASANYYRDKLGFHYERLWGEPPCFTIVHRNGVYIMLSCFERNAPMQPNRLADPSGEAWDAYLWVDDADRLHAEFEANGVNIVRPLCDQPYGNREFDIEDLNGYRLCFAHNIGSR